MAGADQKSFLGTFSPWSTPRSSTPPPDRSSRAGVLQRSQGEDHTVTHRHKLSLRHYPSDCPPLKVRWFYAVDSPKRKPALIDEKKADQKPPPPPKKFIPFSPKDSQSIESTFQRLSEVEDSLEHGQPQSKTSQHKSTNVPVNEDYLFDVDVEHRELSPAYWIGPIYEVRRGTWFFQDSSGMRPCEENLATQLEEGFLKQRPWRTDAAEEKLPERATLDVHDRPERITHSRPGGPVSQPSKSAKFPPGAGEIPTTAASEPQPYRLFGAYMNRIVLYQDASTAWLNTDDFMSRVSTTVYQKLGGIPGTKVVRGFVEPKRARELSDARTSERKPTEKMLGTASSKAPSTNSVQRTEAIAIEAPLMTEPPIDTDYANKRPKSTLERQMSSLAGEPQNPAELEEQARRQEEQEMEDLREVDNEDREREINHLILVTHGIGQRLGLRLESINFIHDVNLLRKTLKSVYKASPDLQALNSAYADKNGNCRVQVLPVCWRHLLDFPYRGVRQNRKELDLTDADSLEDDAYPSLADITLDSVPAVRNLISDLAMDVLLYQSGYCEHISNIVKQECNRILHLYKKRNPSFNGSVSLCGHSLGSAILFDILCHQPGESAAVKSGKPVVGHNEHVPNERGEGQSALNFECEEFFCLGSPIALFQMLKGKTISSHSLLGAKGRKSTLNVELESRTMASLETSKRDLHGGTGRDVIDNSAIISMPKCRDLYNIFHPSDPVSYRIEPLISSAMAGLKPQPLPSVRKSLWTTSGQSLSILRERMGQSVGSLWSNFTSGVASSLLNRSLGLSADESSVATMKSSSDPSEHKRTQSGPPRDASQDSEEHFRTLIDPDIETLYDGFRKSRAVHRKDQTRSASETSADLESDDQERKMRFEDAKVRALNSNGRVDYSIQEGAFDISLIASIASHLTYWGDEDVNHFMLSQMLSRRLEDINKTWSAGL
ncbi:uncharacterized protein N7459_002128 [Penicillium hispanicum]|uniref:uncharacterized protein n=1 Tax=Penicillium hispanicum TaxID=1080232 RepID=UPI002540B11F|nr:uncharacterized protein N7459_002128 [Penicillium hispanicum]KAJ5591759.1 hypothetical protein N7459_002128 [Penicillium hispanicum]